MMIIIAIIIKLAYIKLKYLSPSIVFDISLDLNSLGLCDLSKFFDTLFIFLFSGIASTL